MKILIEDRLQTERLGNQLWVVTENWKVVVDGVLYFVPKGFVTDGASCPRFLTPIVAPMSGPFGEAGVFHDFLFSVDGPDLGLKMSNDIFREIGIYRGSTKFRARAAWSGVACFGWKYWKKGVDKLTEKSCYELIPARLRVANLSMA